LQYQCLDGAPEEIRTPDPQIRSLAVIIPFGKVRTDYRRIHLPSFQRLFDQMANSLGAGRDRALLGSPRIYGFGQCGRHPNCDERTRASRWSAAFFR
jgi:hypothetical protein